MLHGAKVITPRCTKIDSKIKIKIKMAHYRATSPFDTVRPNLYEFENHLGSDFVPTITCMTLQKPQKLSPMPTNPKNYGSQSEQLRCKTTATYDSLSWDNSSWLGSTWAVVSSWCKAWKCSLTLARLWFASLQCSCSLVQTTAHWVFLSQGGTSIQGKRDSCGEL